MQLYTLNIAEILVQEVYPPLFELLTSEEQAEINTFRFSPDKQRTLFAKLLVRMIIQRSGMIQNKDICFNVSAYGKPSISNLPGFHFNVSHAGCWVVCAVDSTPVGVDVEQVTDIDLNISRNYFCKNEHQTIVKDQDPMGKFFEYWTLKESYIKFIGKGLSHPLNAFSIKPSYHCQIRLEVDSKLEEQVFLKLFELDPPYRLAVCASHPNLPESLISCSVKEIISSFAK